MAISRNPSTALHSPRDDVRYAILGADRFRAVASSSFFRKRSDFGVTSTYSSGAMYSSDLSRVMTSGGASEMPLPSPVERMLLSFFARHGLTGMSSGRAFSPIIMPS